MEGHLEVLYNSFTAALWLRQIKEVGQVRVMAQALRNRSRERGQGMVEYALILVLVSIVVIVVLLTMGNQINNVFSNVVVALSGS